MADITITLTSSGVQKFPNLVEKLFPAMNLSTVKAYIKGISFPVSDTLLFDIPTSTPGEVMSFQVNTLADKK